MTGARLGQLLDIRVAEAVARAESERRAKEEAEQAQRQLDDDLMEACARGLENEALRLLDDGANGAYKDCTEGSGTGPFNQHPFTSNTLSVDH